jgi:hypothetical protein
MYPNALASVKRKVTLSAGGFGVGVGAGATVVVAAVATAVVGPGEGVAAELAHAAATRDTHRATHARDVQLDRLCV